MWKPTRHAPTPPLSHPPAESNKKKKEEKRSEKKRCLLHLLVCLLDIPTKHETGDLSACTRIQLVQSMFLHKRVHMHSPGLCTSKRLTLKQGVGTLNKPTC